MEQSRKLNPWIKVFIVIALVALIGNIVLTVLFHKVLGIPSLYSMPLQIFVLMLAFYPVVKWLPTKNERRPMTLPRWVLGATACAVAMFCLNYLLDRFPGTN